jgi:hypothetical protein
MSIAPIVQTVEVKAAPARAFELFVGRIGTWWPGSTVGAQKHANIVIEPVVGGRVYEVDSDGDETPWGAVLAWDPPGRLLIDWQLGEGWKYDARCHTDVEVTFEALASGGTRVTLTHGRLEGFGVIAEDRAAQLRGGWPSKVAAFGEFVDAVVAAQNQVQS